jgi:hypothetical protein
MTNPDPSETNLAPADVTHYETRAERRAERRAAREGAPAWILGAILIIGGLVLMGQNFGINTLDNWWALFILIPAVSSFANAWRTYQATGNWAGATGSLVAGGFLTLLALYLLVGLSLDWSLIGPAFLIVGGLLLLVAALRRQ